MQTRNKVFGAIVSVTLSGSLLVAAEQHQAADLTKIRNAIISGETIELDTGEAGRVKISSNLPDGAQIDPLRIVVTKRLEIASDGRWAGVALDELLEIVKIYGHAASSVKARPLIRIELSKNADGKILEGLIRGIVAKSKEWDDPPGPVKTLYFKNHNPAEKPDRFVPLEIPDIDLDQLNRIEAGTGQPATRPESKSEGGDKPQPEAEGRSQ